jgi:peptidyl-prolyl cis-trans isomerase A (cyclophilin A)
MDPLAMNIARHMGPVAVISLLAFAVGCDQPASSSGTPAKDTGGKPATTGPATGDVRPTPALGNTAKAEPKGPFPESTHEAMKDPSKAKEKAPDTFKVKFDTTVGEFEVECHRDWAPNGVDRFYNMVKIGYFDDISLFRVANSPGKKFVVQWGIHGNPAVSKVWSESNIEPDEVKKSNTRGMLTYAQAGRPKEKGKTAESRSTQVFINYGDNSSLDAQGFAPVCQVLGNGMDVVEKFYSGYGERLTSQQGQIVSQGNEFLRKSYPLLDYIKTARIVGDGAAPATSATASAGGTAKGKEPPPKEDKPKGKSEAPPPPAK